MRPLSLFTDPPMWPVYVAFSQHIASASLSTAKEFSNTPPARLGEAYAPIYPQDFFKTLA